METHMLSGSPEMLSIQAVRENLLICSPPLTHIDSVHFLLWQLGPVRIQLIPVTVNQNQRSDLPSPPSPLLIPYWLYGVQKETM